MAVEPDCFSSPWVDSIRFQLALLGQRGPKALKRKVQGKFTSIVSPRLQNRKGEKKKTKEKKKSSACDLSLPWVLLCFCQLNIATEKIKT